MKQLLRTASALALGGLIAASSVAAKAADLTVTHWGVLMYGAPFAVAKEKGWFAEEGVEVSGFITSKGGGTTLRNALASDVPYGEASLAAVAAASRQGVDLTIIHAGVRSVGDILWVTRGDADIDSIEDLEGRPVSYTSPRSVSQMLLVMSMEESGVGYDNIDAKSLGGVGSGLTALNEGGIDAAVILEPIWTKVSEKYKPAFHVNDYLPPITQTVGVVRSDFIEGNEEMLSGIVEARRRGVEFIYENPEEASTLLAKAYDMDPAVAETALKNVAELEYWSRGDYEFEGMNNMIRGLQLVGAIEEGEFDWSGLVTDAFLPDDLKSE